MYKRQAHDFVTAGDNVGEDIFARGLCLPSDIKMADSDQDVYKRQVSTVFTEPSDMTS